MGLARSRFFAHLPFRAVLRAPQPFTKSLFSATLPITSTQSRTCAENISNSMKTSIEVGGGVPFIGIYLFDIGHRLSCSPDRHRLSQEFYAHLKLHHPSLPAHLGCLEPENSHRNAPASDARRFREV